MKRPFIGLVALGSSAALLLAGCSGTSEDAATASGDDPINITLVYGQTGQFSSFTGNLRKGVDAAVEAINADGGVNGRMIEVLALDDGSDPTQAVSVLTESIDSGGLPDAVIPGSVSNEALALLPLTTEDELFTSTSATNPLVNDPSTYPFVFGNSATQADLVASVVTELKADGVKKLGVVTSGDAFGDSVSSGMQDAAEAAGIEIVDVERPDPAALNLTVEMQRVQAADPDAIYFEFTGYDTIARALEARVAVGATDIPIYGGASVASSPIATLVSEEALEGCQAPASNFTIKQEQEPDYLAPLYEAFAGGNQSVATGGYGWDAIHLIALAFERAGDDTSAQALTDAIVSEDVPADYLAFFPTGTSYTADYRFPELREGSLTLIPCDSEKVDGLYVVD
ncbi:ABC transporter substrate-binding protein [Herbiconiux ginsengi]|uniref:Amino acid/amide ABC transporter substrate-binding protein, HAAT family n=1 Tax=Herbiconiux ginsengi TaxID=381665 RepID=A0A1H3TFW2_9MICO|nr:ABC transporter substrate-binding protein [Herbiconiux ginsengi]SDZ48990.1 amino acid/amide ABC transporter substrate-binding protein, HAAT family [Herbiconiux ginsengi]